MSEYELGGDCLALTGVAGELGVVGSVVEVKWVRLGGYHAKVRVVIGGASQRSKGSATTASDGSLIVALIPPAREGLAEQSRSPGVRR